MPEEFGFVVVAKGESDYRLCKAGLAGVLPVGPRLLRGDWMRDEFMRPSYPTPEAAEEAKKEWIKYTERCLEKKRKRR